MKTSMLKKNLFTAGKVAGVIGATLIQSQWVQAATAAVEVVITAGGTEQAWTPQSYHGSIDYIQRFEGTCKWPNTCYPSKSINKTYPIPAQFSACQTDTSRGNTLPGLSIHPIKIESPGAAAVTKYALYSSPAPGYLHVDATVTASRGTGAEYYANYELHFLCPQPSTWSRTHTQTITVDSKNGYANVGSYTGPIGSNNGVSGTAQLDNNRFKIDVKNSTPADAAITAGMFLDVLNGLKGPKIFALYEPGNIPAATLKVLSSQALTNQGGGSAIADINNNGIDDIVFVSYQDVVNSDGRNEFTYQVGWDIDTEGNPKSWSSLKRVDGTGWEGNGASVALFKPTIAGVATKAIFVNHDQGSQPVNDFRIRYGTLNANGDFMYVNYLPVPSFGANIYGMGAELYDIDNNGLPEIILSGNSTSNINHQYKIGWNLQENATVSNWTTHYGNGSSNSGVTLALANLDRNPRPEIVMAYREPSDNRVYQITGWNLQQNGEPSFWGDRAPLPITFPSTVNHIDLSIMDLDVFGQTTQRGSGHREKAMVISGLDNNPTGVDSFHYSTIRHSNAKDGVHNGNFTNQLKWHRWGSSSYDASQGAICNVGGNSLANAWDAGMYSDEPIVIEAGKPYSITFDAWSPTGETNKVMGAKLGSATTNTMIYRQNLAIGLKPGWNRYQITYNASVTDLNTRLEFFFGGSSAPSKVCIDNVRFSLWLNTTNDFASFPGNSVTNLIKNGSFNYGSMAGWASKSGATGSSLASTKIRNGELCHFTPGATVNQKESIGQNNIALQNGARYRLGFEIRGNYSELPNGGPMVEVKIGADSDFNGSSFLPYFADYVEVSRDKTVKSFDFTMGEATDPVAGLAFFTDVYASNEICIDNISLTKLP